jgi:hypothetical protein
MRCSRRGARGAVLAAITEYDRIGRRNSCTDEAATGLPLVVALRSQGHCENPRCADDVHDPTDAGDSILEIDHIHDLAKGGEDNPAQMIALYPNCRERNRK